MPAKDGDVIVMTRVSAEDRDLIDSAARERGISRSKLLREAIGKVLA